MKVTAPQNENPNNGVSPQVSAFNQLGGKLSVTEKVGFGLGDTASNLLYQAWSVFLAKFYTDVFGIPAKHAALLYLITRIWDMINDPMMGTICDRTNTRWGKFRPYLLWIGVPYGALIYAMFVTPEWSPNAKIVYAYVTYILATMAYTAINIPYSSLMAVMTPDPKERTTLSQYRFFLAFVGKLLINTLMIPLVRFFGSDPASKGFDEAQGYNPVVGYKMTMMVFGAIATVLLLITFLTTRERVKPPKDQKGNFGQDLKDVSKNWPWVLLFFACIFWLIHNAIRDGCVVYYFDYVSENGSNILFTLPLGIFTLDFDLTTTFLTLEVLGMMAGVFLSTPCKKRFGKKTLSIFFIIASAVLGGIFYVLPPDNFVVLAVVNLLRAVVTGALPVFLFAMFTDVTDYHEWKFGRRATGLIIAGIMFAIKMGVAVGGFLLLQILDIYGYEPNVEQSPNAIMGIKLLFSVIPVAFIIVSGIFLLFYPINEKMLETIEIDLKERKNNEQNQ